MVFADSVEVGPSRLGQFTVPVRWPSVAETHTLGHGVGSDSRVGFEEVDNVVNVAVDLSLVFRRGEAMNIVDTGKLSSAQLQIV